MPKLTDIQIRAWIKSGEHFDGRSDGGGLYLCFPKNYAIPFWRFRYRFAGKQRAMVSLCVGLVYSSRDHLIKKARVSFAGFFRAAMRIFLVFPAFQ